MWLVEVEREVEQWVESLSVREFAKVAAAVERPAEDGTFEELRERRLNTMSADERAELDAALAVARLAMEVGEKVRDARVAAGLTQRDLAARMSTSQAAVARLEAGGTSATLATLHKAAAAIEMTVTVDLAGVWLRRSCGGGNVGTAGHHRSQARSEQRHPPQCNGDTGGVSLATTERNPEHAGGDGSLQTREPCRIALVKADTVPELLALPRRVPSLGQAVEQFLAAKRCPLTGAAATPTPSGRWSGPSAATWPSPSSPPRAYAVSSRTAGETLRLRRGTTVSPPWGRSAAGHRRRVG